MLPAHIASEPSGFVLRATSSGRSLYSMTISRPSTSTTLPTFSSGSRLAITWLVISDVGEDVIADVFGPGDIDQGIVDLEVEQLPDAAALGVGHGAALGKGGQHAAVAVGAHGQAIGRFQQESARRRIDRRHRALAEYVQVFFGHPEAVVRGEERERLLVRRRTGHQVERNPHPVPPGRGQDLFDMDLKQACGRRRGRSETCPWDGRTPGGSPALRRPGSRRPARPPGPADPGRGLLPARSGSSMRPAGRPRAAAARKARSRKLPWSCRWAIQLLDQREIDAADLPGQRLSLPGVQAVPRNPADVPARTGAGLPADRRCSTTTSP